jgi:hypothetical protein
LIGDTDSFLQDLYDTPIEVLYDEYSATDESVQTEPTLPNSESSVSSIESQMSTTSELRFLLNQLRRLSDGLRPDIMYYLDQMIGRVLTSSDLFDAALSDWPSDEMPPLEGLSASPTSPIFVGHEAGLMWTNVGPGEGTAVQYALGERHSKGRAGRN